MRTRKLTLTIMWMICSFWSTRDSKSKVNLFSSSIRKHPLLKTKARRWTSRWKRMQLISLCKRKRRLMQLTGRHQRLKLRFPLPRLACRNKHPNLWSVPSKSSYLAISIPPTPISKWVKRAKKEIVRIRLERSLPLMVAAVKEADRIRSLSLVTRSQFRL